MQPVRLGALALFFVLSILSGILILTPSSRAQSVPETPQQVNDRIRSLAATMRMAPHDYVIGSGDLLAIEVFDVKELSKDVRVSQTGTIGIPLVPVRLRVSGLTEIQAEQKIAEVLEANGLISHPEVSVSVKERKSKPITVVGAVPRPLVYQADRQVTLLEVLAEAGGVANDAGDTVIVTRPVSMPLGDPAEPPAIGPEESGSAQAPDQKTSAGSALKSSTDTGSFSNALSAEKPASTVRTSAATANSSANSPAPSEPPRLTNTITINLTELMETGDTANNIVLQAGDVVTVPHAGIVYVLGAVSRPGGFVLMNDRSQMTALKVLALAGGLSRTARKERAVIIRKDSQGQQHEVVVDLKKVMDRQTEDVQLQPSDILYVPDSAARQAMLRALEFGVALGSGVALYRIAYR